MPNHFGARVAISRFQRLKINTRSRPGRCPGLSHFAPLALVTQVLTRLLNCWATIIRQLCGRIDHSCKATKIEKGS